MLSAWVLAYVVHTCAETENLQIQKYSTVAERAQRFCQCYVIIRTSYILSDPQSPTTTMYAFKALQSLTLGRQEDPICKTLRAFDVPLTTADCRACIDPCDLGGCDFI